MPYKDKEEQLAYQREHYRRNRKKANERRARNTKALRLRMRDLVTSYKDVPCTDCDGEFPTVCMDFDHLGDKEFNVGDLSKASSISKLIAEIQKCEVVCSNCHRIRTNDRRLEQVSLAEID